MTLAHIRALAEEYATKYNPTNVAPFPHENVLRDHADLKIYFTELDDPLVSGVILYQNNEFSILVNISKPVTGQHMTLGHELGHYFLHQDIIRQEQGIIDGDMVLDGSNALHRLEDAPAQRVEIEANNFAASLLMPANLVRRAWEATEDIGDCARIFNVSAIAMTVRLTKLGMIA
jgi:Zn-dependent peptidase ImmA (M78 family)